MQPLLAKIPKLIWQTYKGWPLPGDAERCAAIWRIQPGWQWQYRDDAGIRDMMKVFLPEMLEAFDALPLGVMRADMWRYAVLYLYGGVYADIDTVCMEPLPLWTTKSTKEGPHRLVVGLENDANWCQWFLAATPNHPILKRVLDMIVLKVKMGIDLTYEHFVHDTTGPAIWTDAIHKQIGLQQRNAADNFNGVLASPDVIPLDAAAFNGGLVSHHFGSQNFAGYDRWIDLRHEVWKRAKGIA